MYYVGVYRTPPFSLANIGIHKKKQELGQFATHDDALNFIKDKLSVGSYDLVAFWDGDTFDMTRVKWAGKTLYIEGYKASSHREYSQFVQSRAIAANPNFSDGERAQHAASVKDFMDKQKK